MTTKIILAGFGGQGIIAAGKLLASAAMKENKEVTYFPSYGAEMRGGTCSCSVVISDKTIASPIVAKPDFALVLNKPSKIKYESKVVKDGNILINETLVDEKVSRNDLKSNYIKASKIADEMGNPKGVNMVILGAFVKISSTIKLESLYESLTDVFPSMKSDLLEINKKALKAGFDAC